MKCKKKFVSFVLSLCMAVTATSIPVVSAVSTDKSASKASTTTVSTSANAYGLADNIQDGQILQCFNWSFDNIKKNMKTIADQGFTAVQTSPIQVAKESTAGKTAKGSWWVLYQPVDFAIENNSHGSSALGTASQFKAMCDEAHKYGVKVVVDAVLNHMGNKSKNDLSPCIPDEIRNNSSLWHDISKNSRYESRYDITQFCMDGIPDLNTSNKTVQNYAIKFLKECVDNGADGFRFDGAKHIETPADSGFGSEFWPTVLNAITSYAKSTRSITPFYYGEVLDGTTGSNDRSNGQTVANSYTSYMSITLSSVSNDIRNAVNGNNAQGAIRSDYSLDDSTVAGNKAVLWNESHDTYQAGSSSGVGNANMDKTWALVGTRNQACGMYMARPNNWGSAMMGQADVTNWANETVKAINQFKNAMIGQTEYLSAENGIAYNERGTKGVVLVNCGGNSSVSVTAHKMAAGTYTDVITGNTFTVANGKISGNIGSSGVAVVYNAKKGPQNTISKEGGSFKAETLPLTLGLKDATSGTYQIDNGAVETYTGTKTITIGEGVAYGSTITVNLTATDGTDTSKATYTFKKVDPTLTQKIYFDNSSYNWSSVYAYIYNDTDSVAKWPGKQMTKDSSTGYYVVEVPDEFANGSVIFTESSTATTNRYPADMEPGLELSGSSMKFSANHKWEEYTQQTTTTTKPTTTTTKTEPTTATTVPSATYLYGDLNFDNQINVKDAVQVTKYIVSKVTFTDIQKKAADVNGDGNVDVKDATLIQKYGIKVIDTFPAGKTFSYSDPTAPTTSTTKPTTVTTTTKPTTATTATTAPSGNTIKIDMSAITVGNERWAAYLWNDTGSVWVDIKDNTLSVPSGYENLIICRMNGATTENNWDNRWNQSENLKVSGGTTYKATGWGSGNKYTGTWA
ncbi:MAG: alpha-amylase family glycosyl hydrolase [Ruminococcus sp.]|nr:alpha-amylase family glycosyl hydrolase [Ruminococcus sp.]MDD6709687.1 alpha-amylase family glycosyl hydrolase [Ruminococcus sp.]